MRTSLAPLLTLALAMPAAAEPIGADAFEAHVAGRTLSYARDGVVYGVESYLTGRRVRWSFLDGTCDEGWWYPDGEMICFVYEAIPSPQCWRFGLEDGRLMATFGAVPELSPLYETAETELEPVCTGPRVGV